MQSYFIPKKIKINFRLWNIGRLRFWKAVIPKHASVHPLRHSFATHLLMNGVNIREVHELRGYKNVDTYQPDEPFISPAGCG